MFKQVNWWRIWDKCKWRAIFLLMLLPISYFRPQPPPLTIIVKYVWGPYIGFTNYWGYTTIGSTGATNVNTYNGNRKVWPYPDNFNSETGK